MFRSNSKTRLIFEHNRIVRKRLGRAWLWSGIVICFVLLGLVVIEYQPSVAANVADSVLRPVIGNKATVSIESGMLTLSDDLKQMLYATVARPNPNIFTSIPQTSSPKTLAAHTGPRPAVVQTISLDPINDFQTTFPKLTGEGIWNLVDLPQFKGHTVMARSFVRPDPARSYAIVALIKMDMRQLHLHIVAGKVYPGAVLGHPGTGVIPAAVQTGPDLVAAFNGGFQYIDGHYGMAVGNETYVPLQPNTGTLTMYQNGNLTLGPYQAPTPSTPAIEAVRQNGPLIVDRGQVTSNVISGGYRVWGRTTTNSMYTWRSGVGLAGDGSLIYAVGPSLTADTLANALKAAGATEAMQLDINAYWVRFVTFAPKGPSYSYESILNTLANGGYDYLHGYSKDFFYVTLNQALN